MKENNKQKELTLGSLFDGVGGWPLAAERAGIVPVWSSEIEAFPLEVTKVRFPYVKQLGDVTKIDGGTIQPVDILCAGSPCFVAGTLVHTSNGVKAIEDVMQGVDCVLTEDGKYHKVIKTMSRMSEFIYELTAQGLLKTFVTGNHPILVRHKKRYNPQLGNGKKDNYQKFSDTEWIQVKNLQETDVVGYPIIKEERNLEKITAKEAWLIGHYIADGYIHDVQYDGNLEDQSNHQTIFSISNGKLEVFREKITGYDVCVHKDITTCQYEVKSERLMRLCRECGSGAENKEIPYKYLLLPVKLLSALLDGYISGVGNYCSSNKTYFATTISRKLALSLQLAIHKVFRTPCKIRFFKKLSPCIVEGRIVNQRNTYRIEWNQDTPKKVNAFTDGEYIWQPVRSITKINETAMVYNLEVEDVHSYCANGIVVHNCQSLSVAGKREGLAGESGLFLQATRIFREMRKATNNQYPRFFLWENVCFTKETLITTDNGLTEIQDIKKGDTVKTHTGQYCKVEKVIRLKNKKVITVKVNGSEPFRVTPNHPFLVRKLDGMRLSAPDWKPAGKLRSYEDYIGYPVGELKQEDTIGKINAFYMGRHLLSTYIHPFIFNMADNEQLALLRGVLEYAGYKEKSSKINLFIKQRKNAYQIARLVRDVLHIVPALQYDDKQNGYCVSFSFEDDSHPVETGIYQDGFLWMPVAEVIDKEEYEDVFNLTVSGEHTFLANGIAVHNCGAFSSSGGLDFKAVLEEICETEIPMPRSGKWAEAGMVRSRKCDVAWRTMDSQFFGVPQRRRRIFLVGDFATGERCADTVLFEFQSMSGDSSPSGSKEKDTPRSVKKSTGATSRKRHSKPKPKIEPAESLFGTE